MPLAINNGADRLLRRLPRPTVYSAAELVLLVLIAIQAARFVWTLATPVAPVGDWRPSLTAAPGAGDALGGFDPFFRLAAGGPAVVTGLELKLHGVREDRATGRGSAIIALPDGSQRSFAVGEEIIPGVILAEVGFDSVTIDRGGTREQLFLDQSEAAPAAAAPAPPAILPGAESGPPPPEVAPPPPVVRPAPAAAPPPTSAPAIRFQPRARNGRVDGVTVAPGGDGGQAFRAAGFVPGDVIVAVNGQRIESMEQATALIRRSGGEATVVVDRSGQAVPMRVRIPQ